MANKRQAKKLSKQANIKSVEYNKLIKEYNAQKRRISNKGVVVKDRFPKYKEFKEFTPSKKLEVVRNINRDTKTLRGAKVDTPQQRKELQKKGFDINLKGDKKSLARAREKELNAQRKEKERQRRLAERAEAKRVEELARAFRKQQRELERQRRLEQRIAERLEKEREREKLEQTKKNIDTRIKSRNTFFRKYSYSKYKSSVNRLAQDASRYGIQINKDISPEQLNEMLKDPDKLEQIKTIQDTKRLSDRFTRREDVLRTIERLGLEVSNVDDRSKAVSYEEIEKFKRLRRKYNEKRNIYNKYNKSKSELKKADNLEEYLLKSEEERKKVREDMSKVSSRFNSTIKKSATDVDNKVRKELKESDMLEEKDNKKLDTSDENKFKLKLKFTSDEEPAIYVDMFEVLENKSQNINLYNEKGLQTNKEPISLLDLNESEIEQIDKAMEELGVNVEDFYTDIMNNIDSDEEIEEEDKEELIERAKEHLEEKDYGKDVYIELPSESEEDIMDSIDNMLNLDNKIDEVADEEEEDIEKIKAQKRFEKPKFESTSYVWDESMNSYSNFLNKLRRDDNGLSDWQVQKLGIEIFKIFKENAYKLNQVPSQLMNNFFNSLGISEIEEIIPSRWDYESGQDREFLYLNNSMNEMVQNIRERLEDFISELD